MCKSIIKNTLCVLLLSFLEVSIADAQNKSMELRSPNERICVTFHLDDKISYDIRLGNDLLLQNCLLRLDLQNNELLGEKPHLRNMKYSTVNDMIRPVVPLKYSSIKNDYNSLVMNFKSDYSVEFRAFDDGIAYRFMTNKKKEIEVLDELFSISFPETYDLHLQQIWNDDFRSPYEEPYTHLLSSHFTSESKKSVLPILIDTQKGYKILISETDLIDYPVMLVKGTSKGMDGAFAKYPVKIEDEGDRSIKILEEAGYIAKTIGKRNFPWRYFVITENDGQLLENTMSLKLSSKSKIEDVTWIKPGQTVWDWWNNATPYGVDFVAGRNQNTFKYFIDFAAKNNIPYSLIDEGWAKSGYKPFETNPTVNMKELVAYAKQNGVKLILWVPWLAAKNNMDTLFETYGEWGIAGVKIDFMEHNDQWMVNFYEQVAKKAAANKMVVLFHGAFKPAGLEYMYPNVLSYEGVRGLEWQKDCTPDNSIYLPFMRNAVGPMDFTPGAMVSMQPEYYLSANFNPAAVGTRVSQLAHFVVFESGIQMLADNPTRYNKEKECFDFIKRVPVIWDETKALAAKVGEYAIVAKRKGNIWYIGGITNSKEKERNFEINLDFLNRDRNYTMVSFEDGINAEKQAMDYKRNESKVNYGDKIHVRIVKNGGFAAIIE